MSVDDIQIHAQFIGIAENGNIYAKIKGIDGVQFEIDPKYVNSVQLSSKCYTSMNQTDNQYRFDSYHYIFAGIIIVCIVLYYLYIWVLYCIDYRHKPSKSSNCKQQQPDKARKQNDYFTPLDAIGPLDVIGDIDDHKDDNIQQSMSYYNPLRVHDEVHDIIIMDDDIKQIYDTPHFQRLRYLKQLGPTCYIFPSASHTRFEHSLGVYWLARKLMLHLKEYQPNLNIAADEIYCVSAAGLLHDLGHGPFSHSFEGEFVPSMTNSKFHHEDMSIKLIRLLFSDNDIPIKKKSLELICALVSPSNNKKLVKQFQDRSRGFLFEIIANERNGIDVDKFDYFLRDSKNLSINTAFNHTRIMEYIRVIDGHICFHHKTSILIHILYMTRYYLFKQIYSHKTTKVVEYMLLDILRHANGYFKITQKLDKAKDFMELDDSLIRRIEVEPIPSDTEHGNAIAGLKKAKELIKRLRRRDLYKNVAYCLLHPTVLAKEYSSKAQNINGTVFIDGLELYLLENEADVMLTNKLISFLYSNDYDSDTLKDDLFNNQHGDSNIYNFCNNPAFYNKIKKYAETNPKIDYHLIEKHWKRDIYQILLNDNKDLSLKESDIMVQIVSISYGSDTKNPICNVHYYDTNSPDYATKLDTDQISLLSVQKTEYKEVIFRLFVKDKAWCKQCKAAFGKFCKNKNLLKDSKAMGAHSLTVSFETKK